MGEVKPKVFLSYARADDEAFVERLHRDLINGGVEVWWDRAAMESRGRTFLQEIRDAIEGVDRVIAVIGPRATSSEYVRYEWEHALLFAKGIVPILRLGTHELLPPELLGENAEGLATVGFSKLHCPDFRAERPYGDALTELVRILREPMPALGACYAPTLPPHLLPRRDYILRLQESVLADINRPTVIKSAGQVVALQGMGGIGKSVLAAAFAHAIATRRAFPDGIIWLSAGPGATNLTRIGNMRQVGEVLGDAPGHYVEEPTAKLHLATLLEGKVCLMVLDDVWSMDQVEAFRDALGPRCRLLLTTRDAGLVTALGARPHEVNTLGDDQALTLLAEWCGIARDSLPPEARTVAEECGNLPLALSLCGALVRDNPDRWANLLHRLRNADLSKIRRQLPNYPYPDVFRAVQVSVEALTPEERTGYLELAVFPENTPIPEAAIATLWRIDTFDAQDRIDLFVGRALLRRPAQSRVLLHQLQTDYARSYCHELPALHAALIDAYRAVTPAGWASGPDDGYFFGHLPQHLAAADQLGEIRALLCDYDWLAAKLRATNIAAALADYDLIPNGRDVALIQQALRLSIPALSRDLSQLPGQLIGRLQGTEGAAVKVLITGAEKGPGQAWLRPRFASLTPPGGPLLQILVGHTGPVEAVTFLPDGRHALSGSNDNTLRLWDLTTSETLSILEGHTGPVTAVAVVSGGRRALSASKDNTLRLWDLVTGATLCTLEGHTDTVAAVALLADGTRALSSSYDDTLRLWDLATGETLRTLTGHTGSVNAVALLADGRRALSGSDDNTLRLWDLATGETLRTLTGHTDAVTAVAVLADGTRALSHSWDNTLRLWDLATGETLRILEKHLIEAAAVAVLADGRHALAGSWDDTLRLWDLATGETLRTLTGHTGSVNAVALLADDRRALSGSSDCTLRLWDLTSDEALHTLQGHTDRVSAVALLADGSRALSGSWDNTLRLWDLATGESLCTFEGHTRSVNAVAVSADGRRALSGSDDSTLRLCDLATGETLRTLEGHVHRVSVVALLADGSRALSGSWDNTLRLWDLATGETLCTLEGHGGSVTAVAVLAGGSRALSGSYDDTLRLWDLATGETLLTLKGHRELISVVVVLPDNGRALSGSWDRTLRLWDLQTGKILRTLEGHADRVYGVTLLADGSRALSGSRDRTLRLWDLKNGETLRTLTGHTDSVTAVAVLADGSRALSGSRDRTLRLWDLVSGESLAEYTADGFINCVAFARGDLILAGSGDGEIHVLEIREPRLSTNAD
jgi:WD40 repeat protein